MLRQARWVIIIPALVFLCWAWWTGRLRWYEPNLVAFALSATLSTALWLRLVRQSQSTLDLQSPGVHQ